MENRDLITLIYRLIDDRTKFMRSYMGKVTNVNDPDQKARVKVMIPDLGLTDESLAIWCNPCQESGLQLPKKDDFVIVAFMNNNREYPFWLGKADFMLNMKPTQWDNQPDTNVIYESQDNQTYIKHSKQNGELTIKDSTGNEITMKSGEIDIKGVANIKLNGGTEEFVKGGTLYTQLNTIITALQTFTSGLNPTTLAAQATVCNTAMGTALGILSLIKSTTIKGE